MQAVRRLGGTSALASVRTTCNCASSSCTSSHTSSLIGHHCKGWLLVMAGGQGGSCMWQCTTGKLLKMQHMAYLWYCSVLRCCTCTALSMQLNCTPTLAVHQSCTASLSSGQSGLVWHGCSALSHCSRDQAQSRRFTYSQMLQCSCTTLGL